MMNLINQLTELEQRKNSTVVQLATYFMDTSVDLDTRWSVYRKGQKFLPINRWVATWQSPRVDAAVQAYLDRGWVERNQLLDYTDLADRFQGEDFYDEFREEVLATGEQGFRYDW